MHDGIPDVMNMSQTEKLKVQELPPNKTSTKQDAKQLAVHTKKQQKIISIMTFRAAVIHHYLASSCGKLWPRSQVAPALDGVCASKT